MIEITRALARRFRAVLRKSLPLGAGKNLRSVVQIQAGRDGLRLQCVEIEVAVEYHLPGNFSPESIALPAESLADFEGGKDSPVLLEASGANTVQARWDDAGVPQVRDYAAPEAKSIPAFPDPPDGFVAMEPGFLQALDEASRCAAREGVRYALHKLQLRGGSGAVVGSDGRQLLIRKGFRFPWDGDLLVPALAVFGCRELAVDGPALVGYTTTHVAVRVGPWTFLLQVDKEARYPNVETVIPSLLGTVTTGRLTAEDAAFLAHALPRLPGAEDTDSPVTIDLNGHVAARAKADNQVRPVELVLSHSTVNGPPLRFRSNRQCLVRMLQLGIHEMCVVKADVPVVCRDEKRTFVWMPLGKEGAVPPSDDCQRIASNGKVPMPSPATQERRIIPMTTPSANGSKNGHPTSHENGAAQHKSITNFTGLIEEAQALRSLLRDALVRTNQLLIAAKQQKKQSHLLRTTLATLKQLQNVQA